MGTVCRPCSRNRRREFEKKYRKARTANRTQHLSMVANPDPAKSISKYIKEGKGELAVKQLEVATALKQGADVLNRRSRWILARLLRYLHDPSHPHHEWAFKFVMERTMPKKLYEDLGAAAAGMKKGESGAKLPPINIIVQPAILPPSAEPSVTVTQTYENGAE